ncbi:transglycosylase SLT domain-containing protein [bacterium]|nr:transglycosylase SLT domain-containing protein [bacterium]
MLKNKVFYQVNHFMVYILAFCLSLLSICPILADEKEADWVTPLLIGKEHMEVGEYAKAWMIWDQLIFDCPIRYHAIHLAAQARINFLETARDVSQEDAKTIRQNLLESLDKLSKTRDYPFSDAAKRDLLRFLERSENWSELLLRIPKGTDDTEYRLMKTRSYVKKRLWAKAETLLRKLWIYDSDSQFTDSIDELYRRVLTENKKTYPAVTQKQLFAHTRSLDRVGYRYKATTVYENIITMNLSKKLTVQTQMYLAKIYYDTRQNKKALAVYDRFISENPENSSVSTALFRKGIIFRRQKKDKSYLEMIATIERSHVSSKWWSVVLLGRGDYWRSKKLWDKADKDYEKVISAGRGKRDTALWKWSWLAFNRDQPDLASARLDKMYRLYKNSGWDLPIKYWRLRFQQIAGKDLSDELMKLAKAHSWEFYGQMAALNMGHKTTDYMKKSKICPVPKMSLQEQTMDSVQAAILLEKGQYWDRAATEWHRAAKKIRNESEGFIIRRAECLQKTGDVPASRRLLISYYNERLNDGKIPLEAIQLLYPIPEELRKIYCNSAEQVDLDPLLAMAVTLQESGFDQRALSHNLAGGLMQVMPELFRRFSSNWEDVPPVEDYQKPEHNIRAGTEYLAWLLERFEGSIPKALAGYNAGEHRVEEWEKDYPYPDEIWVEHIPFQQTRLFVKHVWKNYRAYQVIYDTGFSLDD